MKQRGPKPTIQDPDNLPIARIGAFGLVSPAGVEIVRREV
jgi:hypothetical protein